MYDGNLFWLHSGLWLARIGKQLWNDILCTVRQMAFGHCEHQYLLRLQNRTIFLWSACNFEKDCQLDCGKVSPEMKIALQHKILFLQLKWPGCLPTSSRCQPFTPPDRQLARGSCDCCQTLYIVEKIKGLGVQGKREKGFNCIPEISGRFFLDFWGLNREVISWWCLDCKASKRRVENNWASFIKVLLYTEFSSQCRAIVTIFIAQSTVFPSWGD